MQKNLEYKKEQMEHIFERYYRLDKSKYLTGLRIRISIGYRIMELIINF